MLSIDGLISQYQLFRCFCQLLYSFVMILKLSFTCTNQELRHNGLNCRFLFCCPQRWQYNDPKMSNMKLLIDVFFDIMFALACMDKLICFCFSSTVPERCNPVNRANMITVRAINSRQIINLVQSSSKIKYLVS